MINVDLFMKVKKSIPRPSVIEAQKVTCHKLYKIFIHCLPVVK